MAFQYGVAQTVQMVCYDGETPTDPTTPVATVSTDGGAFAAADNAPDVVSDGLVTLELSIAEMTGDVVAVKIASDDLEDQIATFYTEDAWTAAKATLIEAMRGTDNAALASIATETRLAELDAGNLPAEVAAVPTAAQNATAVQEFDAAPYEATADTGTRAIELLCASRGAVAGRMSVAGDVLTIYEVDGVTPMETYTLTPAGGPYTARTP